MRRHVDARLFPLALALAVALPLASFPALPAPPPPLSVASRPGRARRLKLTTADEWLFWTDTVGLGVFAANGALAAAVLTPRIHGVACACCGMFSATFGGLTRDVLLGRPPRILYAEADLYATPPFIGGLATAMLVRMDPEREADSVMLGFFVTVLLRVLAYNEPVRLPVFPASAIYSVDQRQKSRFFGEPSTARQASRWLSNASVYDSTVYDSMVSSVCDAVMAKAGQSSRASFVPSTFRQPLAPDAARGRESRCHLKGAISAVQAVNKARAAPRRPNRERRPHRPLS